MEKIVAEKKGNATIILIQPVPEGSRIVMGEIWFHREAGYLYWSKEKGYRTDELLRIAFRMMWMRIMLFFGVR